MSRALVISILVFGFATSLACSNDKHGTAIRRQKPGTNKNGLAAKVKAEGDAEKEAKEKKTSPKTSAFIKHSFAQCLNMDWISKDIQTGEDKYTAYTRDADVGVIEKYPENPNVCYSFTSLKDKVIRGQHAFTQLPTVGFRKYAPDLATIGDMLKISGQNECESATFLGHPEVYKAECETPGALTLVKTDAKGIVTEVRNYRLGDNELILTHYVATHSNSKCDSPKKSVVFTRTVTVIAFEWLERVELRTSYAQLLNTYVTPKQPDLAAAIANAAPVMSEKLEPEQKRPSSSDTLTIATPVYELLIDSIKNGNVEFPECKGSNKTAETPQRPFQPKAL